MKKKLLLLFCTFTVVVCAQQPGDIISFEKKLDLTPSGVVNFMYQHAGKQTPKELLNHLNRIKKGLEGYKLTYYTKDYNDNLVKATGLVMYPKTDKKLSTVLYCHPTTNGRDFVPSNLKDIYAVGFVLPLTYALNEYIVVAPDYYGMGGGDGTQNYTEAKTTVDSTLDMMKAANTFLDQIGMERYNENFITGYSLGSHAAMATLKKATEDNLYRFKYAYLGAGPHDLSHSTLQEGVLDKKIFPVSSFLANVIYTCNKIGYKVKEDNEGWDKIITAKYLPKFTTSTLEDKGGILWGPIVWRRLFQKEFIKGLEKDQNHPIRKCLRASDVYDWNNTTPTTLMDGAWDLIINPNNNKVALEAQRAYYEGSLDKYKIKRVQTGPFTHITGILPWIVASTYRFNTLRKGGFFNFRAERIYKNRNNGNEEIPSISIERSTVKPLVILGGKEKEITITGMQSQVASRSTEVSNEKSDIYFAETTIKGKKMSFPMVVEKAIAVNTDDILHKKSATEWAIDLQGLSEKVTTIRFFDANKHVVKTVTPSENLVFNTDNLVGNEMIEIVTENSIFTTQFNENVVDSRTVEVEKNRDNVVVKTPSFMIKSLEVYNILGQRIFSKNNIDATIYMFKNQEGINLIKLYDAKGNVYTKKVAFK